MRPTARPLACLALLAASLVGPACVVSYGNATGVRPAEPLPPPNDFAEVEVRLDLLVANETEVDRRDRLDAALDLLRAGRTMESKAQERVLRYLQLLVTIEERGEPVDAPALFAETLPETTATFSPLIGGIEEEDLGGFEELSAPPPEELDALEELDAPDDALRDAPEDAPEEAPTGAADPVSAARAALEAGDPAGALAALSPCGVVDCADDAEALREEAEEAWIHAERERAGALFVRARSEPDATERMGRLVEAREILAGLVDRFPDAEQVEAIRRNIDLVQKELDTLR